MYTLKRRKFGEQEWTPVAKSPSLEGLKVMVSGGHCELSIWKDDEIVAIKQGNRWATIDKSVEFVSTSIVSKQQ